MIKKYILLTFFSFSIIQSSETDLLNHRTSDGRYILYSKEQVTENPMTILSNLLTLRAKFGDKPLKQLYYHCLKYYRSNDRYNLYFDNSNVDEATIKALQEVQLCSKYNCIYAETVQIIMHCIHAQKKCLIFCCCHDLFLKDPLTGDIYDNDYRDYHEN